MTNREFGFFIAGLFTAAIADPIIIAILRKMGMPL